MNVFFRHGPSLAAAAMIAAAAVLGAGCKESVETDPTLLADQQKAASARAAAEQECESLPSQARQDCMSVAAKEYERLMSEAKERGEKTAS